LGKIAKLFLRKSACFANEADQIPTIFFRDEAGRCKKEGVPMWLDIAVALIFVISAAQGLRKGFVSTFVHALGWLIAVVISYASYPMLADFLRQKTGFYEFLHMKIRLRLAESSDSSAVLDGLPKLLQDTVGSIRDSIAETLATGLSDFFFRMLCFLLVVFAVRFILLFLTSLLSKKNGGFTGFVDGFFGLLAGAVKGILLNFVFLALFVPAIGLSSGEGLLAALNSSLLAKTLYDNNLLFLIVHDFL